jgi:hypothetical protein
MEKFGINFQSKRNVRLEYILVALGSRVIFEVISSKLIEFFCVGTRLVVELIEYILKHNEKLDFFIT